MIANTKTNKNKNSKIFNLVNNIYLSFKLNSKRYSLLFAALLSVYAQADVSVSDDLLEHHRYTHLRNAV